MIHIKYICKLVGFLLFHLFFLKQKAASEELVPSIYNDSTQIRFWNITARTGEIIPTSPDTFLTDYYKKNDIEGKGISIAYLGNWGSPAYSRFFFERKETPLFLFQNAYTFYRKTPDSFHFINTKLPYSRLSYQRSCVESPEINEFLQSLFTFNFGEKINCGFAIDYLYARGCYQSQSAKYLDLVCFGNYISDHHRLHYFLNSFNHIHAENGGIIDDQSIIFHSQDILTYLSSKKNSTWNALIGNQFFLNYHYNLKIKKTDTINHDAKYTPFASIIYTLDCNNCQKRFYTDDSTIVADFYNKKKDNFPTQIGGVNDSASYSAISNTIAFSIWKSFFQMEKCRYTFFFTQDFDFFSIINIPSHAQQTSTYIGSECTKRNDENIIQSHIQGAYVIKGENKKDFNISAIKEISISYLKDSIRIKMQASLKKISPNYFENHYVSRYFKWDNQFDKIQKQWLNLVFDMSKTKSYFQLQFENINRLIFFNENGNPDQHKGNIRIFAANFNQNFKILSCHSDNKIVYQVSNRPTILPLPNFIFCSNLYFQFKIANTLRAQAGINTCFWTKYYAPTYELAIQQFKLQHDLLVGNYPLISCFLNCHLKQTHFFIEYYNIGKIFFPSPNYFSLPHYPINPPFIKLGLFIDFFN